MRPSWCAMDNSEAKYLEKIYKMQQMYSILSLLLMNKTLSHVRIWHLHPNLTSTYLQLYKTTALLIHIGTYTYVLGLFVFICHSTMTSPQCQRHEHQYKNLSSSRRLLLTQIVENWIMSHSWPKFKIIWIKKLRRKFNYFPLFV